MFKNEIKTYNEKPLYYYRRNFSTTTTVGVDLPKHMGLFYAYNTAANIIRDSGCYNIASVVNDSKILSEALGVLRTTRDKNYDHVKSFVSALEEFFNQLPETYQIYLMSFLPKYAQAFMKKSTTAKIVAVMVEYDRLYRYKNKIKTFLRKLLSPVKWLVHYLLTIYKLCIILAKVIIYFIRAIIARISLYIKTWH